MKLSQAMLQPVALNTSMGAVSVVDAACLIKVYVSEAKVQAFSYSEGLV